MMSLSWATALHGDVAEIATKNSVVPGMQNLRRSDTGVIIALRLFADLGNGRRWLTLAIPESLLSGAQKALSSMGNFMASGASMYFRPDGVFVGFYLARRKDLNNAAKHMLRRSTAFADSQISMKIDQANVLDAPFIKKLIAKRS
jgi:hypothetical protein